MSHPVARNATPTNGGGKAARKAQPWDNNPGWFMEPVWAWKSLRFESKLCKAPERYQNTSYAAMLTRNRRLEAGSEEAKGTLWMPGTRDGAMPAWLGAAPKRMAAKVAE